MLSYRHAFHAGNHADVLKHCVLVQLLRHMNLKDKPYWVVDTHAGAGRYLLDSEFALKNAEFATGIARLWSQSNLPAPLADYVEVVRGMNSGGKLRHYPGSPWLAHELARSSARLRLFELHGTDHAQLEKVFAKAGARVAIRRTDGFAELKSVLPPPPRRGLILIDPAYEDKRDYLRVVAALKEGLNRFSTGVFAVWYPLLGRADAGRLRDKLRKLPVKWLDATLTVRSPPADGFGMYGSGVFVVNPPWTLADELREVLPFLAETLAVDGGARYDLAVSSTFPG
ncbi:MAG TPA: 23S rRNA (adenine(2030)-N(6))-methyltransferase RlmJ [Rhodocyclaceae bacterium]|nr:23S rRNA (adenine(2030)-N(6))-methyltransferase RlmJ [Rhodocyclaceae bacterium]